MKDSVSIYFVKTELETLAAEVIADQFGSTHANVLVYNGKHTPYLVNQVAFDTVIRFSDRKETGFFKEKRSIYNGLKNLAAEIERLPHCPTDIYIHLPRLSTSKTNYSINYLIKRFPSSTVRVRLIPHGVVSTALIPLTPARRLKLWRRLLSPANLLFPGLRYYPPTSDLIGGLDPIVDRVYTFQGIASPFPAPNVLELTGLRNYIQTTPKARAERSAIVIGQPLQENGLISEENHSIVTQQIVDWLKENAIETIYYSKHPRSREQLDFFHEGYEILQQEGAVEVALCKIQPEVVISCYSTALATAKGLFGDEIKVISFGLMLSQSDKKEGLAAFFESVGIEVR